MLFFSSSFFKLNSRKTYFIFFSLSSSSATLFNFHSSFNSFSLFFNRRFHSSLLNGSSSFMDDSFLASLHSLPQHKVSISQHDLNWIFGFFESSGTFFLTHNNHSFYDLSYFFNYFLLNPGLFLHYFSFSNFSSFASSPSGTLGITSKPNFFFNSLLFSHSSSNSFDPLLDTQLFFFFFFKKHDPFLFHPSYFYKYSPFSSSPSSPSFSFLESDLFFLFRENSPFLSTFSPPSYLREWKLGFMLTHFDPQVLYKVRQILGFGTVKPYSFHTNTLSLLNLNINPRFSNFNYYKYVILDFNGLSRLFFLFLSSPHSSFFLFNKKFFFFFQIFQFLIHFNFFSHDSYLFSHSSFFSKHPFFLLNIDFQRFSFYFKSNFFLSPFFYPFFQNNFFLPFGPFGLSSSFLTLFKPFPFRLFEPLPGRFSQSLPFFFFNFNNSFFSGILDSLACFNVSYSWLISVKRHNIDSFLFKNNLFSLNFFLYFYTHFCSPLFLFFLNHFFSKNPAFLKFYFLPYFKFNLFFLFLSYLYTKSNFFFFLYSHYFVSFFRFFSFFPLFFSNFSSFLPFFYFYFKHSLPFCFFHVSFSFSFLFYFLPFNSLSLNQPFLELVIFSSFKEDISFIQIFNLTMLLRFFPLHSKLNFDKSTLSTQSTKDSFLFLFKYLKSFPLKSKKKISFIRFTKLFLRLNDSFFLHSRNLGLPKCKRLFRFKRLVNSLSSSSSSSSFR